MGHRAWQGLPAIGRVERRSWFILAAGLPTATSSLLAFRALSLGDASRVSPLTNISLAFTVILAAVSSREKLTRQIMTGALLIATAKPAKQPDAGNKNGRSETEATIYKTKSKA